MSSVWLRRVIRIVLLCFVLYISTYIHLSSLTTNHGPTRTFSSETDNEEKNLDDFISTGFSHVELEQAKVHETELEHEYDITAILIHWKRLSDIQKTLERFLNTNLFKEIIVWNNNPEVNLSVHHLIVNNKDSSNLIRIINSKVNLIHEAKYRACAEAKSRACFYVDDDCDTSHYMRSLIASFRSDPNVLHSVTDSYTYYTNLIWSYFDTQIDLHTGLSWMSRGSIFLRKHAEKHIKLMDKFLKNDSHLITLSDVFFSIWLNDIPSQMNTNTRVQRSNSLNESVAFSSTANFTELLYNSSVLAIRILEHFLRLNRSNSTDMIFPRQQHRHFPYYVKSPSFNDDLIFYTNVLPFELQNIPFNISRDFERATRQNLPSGPDVDYFTHNSTWKALDSNLITCWCSTRTIRSGDFFAIDFLQIKTALTFILYVTHSSAMQVKLDISMSLDGNRWISYRSQKGIYTKMNKNPPPYLLTVLFRSDQFDHGFESFRYIIFNATENFDHRFQVCELHIISKEELNGTLNDFQLLNK